MVRMSDLLKKAKEQAEKDREEPRRTAPRSPRKEKPTPPRKEEPPRVQKEPTPPRPTKPPEEEAVKFSDLVLEHARESGGEKEEVVPKDFMASSTLDEEGTKKIYFEAIESVKRIFNSYKEGNEINRNDVINLANKIVNNTMTDSHIFLRLFHELDCLEFYTCYNAVNVSILSVELGLIYKYNKSVLLELTIVGLLHDMELMKNKEIIDKPEKLGAKELKEIMKHPLNIATYADNAFNLSKDIVNAILQHHEREGGQGYPAGLTNGDIQDLAVIVGIADTYEAMTHSRPHKEKMVPHEAVLSMVKSGKELFSTEAVKALIACVGLYPVGSWVELNTGEMCKVFEVNRDFPLRPVIGIFMDKDRNKFKEVRTVNLREIPSLYIAGIAKNVDEGGGEKV